VTVYSACRWLCLLEGDVCLSARSGEPVSIPVVRTATGCSATLTFAALSSVYLMSKVYRGSLDRNGSRI